jgi:hypothetical protein
MNSSVAAALSILFVSVCAAAEPDSRFDGIWVGIETVTPQSEVRPDLQKRIPAPHKTTIVVAQGGTQLGIIDGICSGRYPRVQRKGDSLTVTFGECKIKVILSSDGKTLIEQGSYSMPTELHVNMVSGQSWPVTWLPVQMTGEFHKLK